MCKYLSWLAAVVPSVLIVSQIIRDVCQNPSIQLYCKPLPEAERGYVFTRARESTQSK